MSQFARQYAGLCHNLHGSKLVSVTIYTVVRWFVSEFALYTDLCRNSHGIDCCTARQNGVPYKFYFVFLVCSFSKPCLVLRTIKIETILFCRFLVNLVTNNGLST